MMDEEHIIQDILRGNKEAFRALVERYQKPVFRVIYQQVSDSHIVEDIAQDVFIAAYEKLAGYDPDRSEFSTWLFTIARNKSLNHIRKKNGCLGLSIRMRLCRPIRRRRYAPKNYLCN
jgi:RNA polymerase sigma-70 factor (ECF subfamily)